MVASWFDIAYAIWRNNPLPEEYTCPFCRFLGMSQQCLLRFSGTVFQRVASELWVVIHCWQYKQHVFGTNREYYLIHSEGVVTFFLLVGITSCVVCYLSSTFSRIHFQHTVVVGNRLPLCPGFRRNCRSCHSSFTSLVRVQPQYFPQGSFRRPFDTVYCFLDKNICVIMAIPVAVFPIKVILVYPPDPPGNLSFKILEISKSF